MTKTYPISSWTGESPTHMGKMYVTITYKGSSVQEIIGTIGGSNSCMRAEVEAISRVVNVAISHGAMLSEIVGQLDGISCEPVWFNGVQIKSPADAIGKILGEFIKFFTGI